MGRTIVINQTNLIQNGFNNSFQYNFPNSVDLTGCQIAISSISMYYSWNNIDTGILNNNFYSYNWVVGGISTLFNVVMPPGLYEISDINNYLRFTMEQNKHYLIDSAGNFVYYAQWVVSPTLYAVNLNTFPVPTALPVGWSLPVGATWALPAATFNPIVSTPANFNKIVGFASTFSSSLNTGLNTSLSYFSSITPQVQPNSNLLIELSNIDNKYASPSSIIYSLSPSVNIGEQIIERPPQYAFNKLLPGTYNNLRLRFIGTDFNNISIRDPQITILLTIEDPTEGSTTLNTFNNSVNQSLYRSGLMQNKASGF